MAEFFVQVADDPVGPPHPSVGEGRSFQRGSYRAMAQDVTRMAHYRRDIARFAPGARILEVSPN